MSELVLKSNTTNLFHNSVNCHRRRLGAFFRLHYNTGGCVWTKDLSEREINDLRLHLSWDMGVWTFSWSRETIGTRIIYRFKELGIFLFLNHVLMNNSRKQQLIRTWSSDLSLHYTHFGSMRSLDVCLVQNSNLVQIQNGWNENYSRIQTKS